MYNVIDLFHHTEDEPCIAYTGTKEQCEAFITGLGCNAVGLQIVESI